MNIKNGKKIIFFDSFSYIFSLLEHFFLGFYLCINKYHYLCTNKRYVIKHIQYDTQYSTYNSRGRGGRERLLRQEKDCS
jgi:hypothetical protein